MKKIIRVGSRDSKLAVMQTKLVMQQIMQQNQNIEIELELVTLKTTGDKILDKTLDKIGGKGLFVKELDQALYDGRIDISVHSLKDVPMELAMDIPLVAFAKRGEARDVLVLPQNTMRKEMESKIGSSSARRQLQLKKLFPNAQVHSIRGNIITRLQKLDNGEYSSLVLAGAGLIRAELEHRISRYFSVEEMIPAAGQGILAVQARSDFDCSILEGINHKETMYQALAERSFVRELDGGCSSPIAAFAQTDKTELKLMGLYYSEETKEYSIDSIVGKIEDAEGIGKKLAEQLKKKMEHESK